MERQFYTPNGWEGSEYQATKNLDIAEIAKLVRREIKQQYPEIRTSVRIERYSMGQSLNVRISESPEPLHNPDYDSDYNWAVRCGMAEISPDHEKLTTYLTARGQEIESGIKAIIEKYNYDDSDTMTDYFDVNFYSNVHIEAQV